jgi:hypothetical protein
MRNTPVEVGIRGRAFKPQNVNSSAVNGADIAEPWKYGKTLVLTLLAGAMTTNDALTITVQGKKKSDSSYVSLKQSDGTTALTFTVSKTSNGGVLDDTGGDGFLMGSIQLDRLKSGLTGDEFTALRITAINAAAQNVILSASYAIHDLYKSPPPSAVLNVDDLLGKQLTIAA